MTSRDFKLIANLIAKSSKVQCLPNKNPLDPVWKANPVKQTIYYPCNTKYTNSELGFLIHEIGHLKFTMGSSHLQIGSKHLKKWIEKWKKPAEQIWGLLNALEDLRVEDKMKQLYKGASIYLTASALNAKQHDIDVARFLSPAKYRDTSQADWFHYCKYILWFYCLGQKEADEYLKRWKTNKIVKETIKKTSSIIKKVFECKNTKEVCELMGELIEFYLPLCKDEQKMDKEMTKKMLKELIKLIQKIKIKVGTCELGSTKRKVSKKEISKIFDRDPTSHTISTEQLLDAVKRNMPKVRKAISILKDMDIVRFEGNYQSGKLQNRRLYKIKTGQTNIFTRKIAQSETKDMVFALLSDESGSMRGRKAKENCIATTTLAKALEKANKPFGVFGFNQFYYTHKKFGEKLKLDEMKNIIRNTASTSFGNGYNNDGYAIKRTIEVLAQQPQKKKILIVLSDGQPAPYPYGDKINYLDYGLKAEAKKAESIATVYGIGILSSAVENYYKNYIILRDPSQLGNELFKIFRKEVGKRTR